MWQLVKVLSQWRLFAWLILVTKKQAPFPVVYQQHFIYFHCYYSNGKLSLNRNIEWP